MSPTNAQPARLVEVADVVGGVAGRVLDAERALDVRFAAAGCAGCPPGPARPRPTGPQTLLARRRGGRRWRQPRGVDEVLGAALVDVDGEVGQRRTSAPRAGMVEVDVGQQQGLRGSVADRGEQRLLA